MKVLPTIALGLVVLIAAVFLLGSSLCAARNDIFDTGGRIAAGLGAPSQPRSDAWRNRADCTD